MLDSWTSDEPDWASSPGDTIVSILEERELSLEQFASKIGRSAAGAQKILDGQQAIDRELARQLASALGASENFWIAREYDYRASVSKPDDVQIASLGDLIAKLPVKDMENYGWIAGSFSHEDRLAECLTFFGVSSLAQWQGRYEGAFQQAAFRRSPTYKACEISTTAWLRKGELDTQSDVVADWSPNVLEALIPNFRRLTWYKRPDLFLPRVKELFAQAGVKFAIVRAPKGCPASGAVRLLSDGTPHVQLSFRYLSDDQFWFSLFHEIGHLLCHYDLMPIFEDSRTENENIEQEADQFAASIIVPVEFREELNMLGSSRFPIIQFAKKIGVAPGLIVGQLHHKGVIRFSRMQHLKRRYRWTD